MNAVHARPRPFRKLLWIGLAFVVCATGAWFGAGLRQVPAAAAPAVAGTRDDSEDYATLRRELQQLRGQVALAARAKPAAHLAAPAAPDPATPAAAGDEADPVAAAKEARFFPDYFAQLDSFRQSTPTDGEYTASLQKRLIDPKHGGPPLKEAACSHRSCRMTFTGTTSAAEGTASVRRLLRATGERFDEMSIYSPPGEGTTIVHASRTGFQLPAPNEP